MTTNKLGFISKLFVVSITFLIFVLIEKFNLLDFTYLIFITICFIKYIYIQSKIEE